MKQRVPVSVEDAITIIFAALGPGTCCQVTGKSESLIRKWSDPDQDVAIPIHQAIALDNAYMAVYGESPIQQAYARAVDAPAAVGGETISLMEAALTLSGELGQFASAVQQAVQPASADGAALSRNEAIVLLKELQDLIDVALRTSADINATLGK